jgi:biotin transporter BioY
MRWSEIIGNMLRAFARPSAGMICAGALMIAAACLGSVASHWRDAETSPASTFLALLAAIAFLAGVLWFSFALLHRAGWVPAEDWKMHVALVRDYLKGLVIRDRR